MNELAKYFFLIIGVLSAVMAMANGNIAAGIVSVGTFISFTMMELAEFKPKK
jgi:hypothetical protein